MFIAPPVLIPSAIQAVLTMVTKMAATVGPMIVKYAPIALEAFGKHLPKLLHTLEAVSMVTNVLRQNEQAEDLGAKAMVAEKKPEDFDAINNYIHYLRDGVVLDKHTLSHDDTDVIARQAIGAAILLKAVEETLDLGTPISMSFLKTVSESGIDASVILSIIKSYTESGLNLSDLDGYLKSQLSLAESGKHSEALVEAFSQANPAMSLEQAEDAVMAMR
ncbi:hypothetical protein [Photobacterium nomapromontoriensis]|uniref:hypothetical protein n=1 Tax=Photobacterium nomapromontoriensis TaxID=2910237 RepID=UPI003D1305D5